MSRLTAIRRLFLGFLSVLVLIGIVLLLIDVKEPEGSTIWPAYVLVPLGIVSTFLAFTLKRRVLLNRTQPDVGLRYTQAVILGISFAELPALVGFVLSVLAGVKWPYALGAAIAVTGMYLIAPTPSDVERCTILLREHGETANLAQALQEPQQPGSRR